MIKPKRRRSIKVRELFEHYPGGRCQLFAGPGIASRLIRFWETHGAEVEVERFEDFGTIWKRRWWYEKQWMSFTEVYSEEREWFAWIKKGNAST